MALTVLGRPPGVPLQEEDELEDTEVREDSELCSSLPTSPALSARQRRSSLQEEPLNDGSAGGVRPDAALQVHTIIQLHLPQRFHQKTDVCVFLISCFFLFPFETCDLTLTMKCFHFSESLLLFSGLVIINNDVMNDIYSS